MRFINKESPCFEFDDFLEKFGQRLKGGQAWSKLKRITAKNKYGERIYIGKQIRLILFNHLRRQQQGLCIYCQQSIPEKAGAGEDKYAHIEHIKKRANFEELIFDQGNMAVSCNGFDCTMEDLEEDATIKEFCGHFKDGRYTTIEMDWTLFLHPFEIKDIDSYFEHEFSESFDDIYITSNPHKTEIEQTKAKYSAQLLNLNQETLRAMRRRQYDLVLENLQAGMDMKDYLSEGYEELPPFYSMLKEKFL